MSDLLSRAELVHYFRTEEWADEVADIISNFPPAEMPPGHTDIPPKAVEGLRDTIVQLIHKHVAMDVWDDLIGVEDAAEAIEAVCLNHIQKSAPPILTPRHASPSGERLPSSDAAVGGADTPSHIQKDEK